MISNGITEFEARKQIDAREMYDTQEEQLNTSLRQKLNMVFWGRPMWIRLWIRTDMLHIVDLVSEGLEEQL